MFNQGYWTFGNHNDADTTTIIHDVVANNHGAASLSGLETEELSTEAAPAEVGSFYYFGEDSSCTTQCAARGMRCSALKQLGATALSRSELDAIVGRGGVDSTGFSVTSGIFHPAGPSIHANGSRWVGLGNSDSTCDADGGNDWRRVCWCE